MEKSKAGLLALIRKAAFPDELATAGIRLSVAKNAFSLAAAAYFSLYLFAVGGLWRESAAALVTLFFPAFFFTACALLYELANYFLRIRYERFANARYAAFGFCCLLFLLVNAAYFGLI